MRVFLISGFELQGGWAGCSLDVYRHGSKVGYRRKVLQQRQPASSAIYQ